MSDHSNLIPEGEAERRIWQSAQQVQRSEYWRHQLDLLDQEIFQCAAELKDHVLNGRNAQAINCAAKMHAYEWLLTTMDTTIRDLAPLDQVEEVLARV